MEASIIIQNLKCGGCANTITKGLTEINGVTEVKIDVAKSYVSCAIGKMG